MHIQKRVEHPPTLERKRTQWPDAESLGVKILRLLQEKEQKLNSPFYRGATNESGWARPREVRPVEANCSRTTIVMNLLIREGLVDTAPYQSLCVPVPSECSRMYRISTLGKEFLDNLM